VLRCYRPSATVAFGRRDTFLPDFAAAAVAARRHGFVPVVRAPGGRVAAYDRGCLVLDEIVPATDAVAGIEERFRDEAERHAAALRRLGVDARVGEVPGEYCPGTFSVNAGGLRKLGGSAQRTIRGGWMLSTVFVVDGIERVRDVLKDVHAALGLSWDPATVGAVAAEAPGVTADEVEAVLLDSYRGRHALREGAIGARARAAALASLARHEVA
jgi:lipoate-protein ligase A